MRQSTKEKIVKWVKVALNYTPEPPPFIVHQREVEIQDLHWIGVVEEYDHDNRLKEVVANEITRKIIEKDLIKIKSSFIGHAGVWAAKRYQVNATLSVVMLDRGDYDEYDSEYCNSLMP